VTIIHIRYKNFTCYRK